MAEVLLILCRFLSTYVYYNILFGIWLTTHAQACFLTAHTLLYANRTGFKSSRPAYNLVER